MYGSRHERKTAMLARSMFVAAGFFLASSAFADSIPPLPSERTPVLLCYTMPVSPDRQTVRLSQGLGLADIKAELFTITADSVTIKEWQVQRDDQSAGGALDVVYVGDGFRLHE